MKFTEALKTKRLYLDGAMGSLLQAKLENIGPVPEALTLTHPEIIQDIHRAYIEAGADIITTCTFGANGYKLNDTEYDQGAIITAAVKLAKELKPGYVALDIGPLGALIGSLGEISFDEAYHYFAQMVEIGAAAGADVLLIETVTDIYEMKAAVLAAKEHSNLPVIASMTFEENGRTLTVVSYTHLDVYKRQLLKERLANGETLDDILVEAFATVREAAYRSIGMKHFPVQLLGGMVLHEGNIAEMKTGEGKTLVSTLPAYLNALEGKGVYIVTVNDYLAKRDSEWMGKVHAFLGLKVGLVVHGPVSYTHLGYEDRRAGS